MRITTNQQEKRNSNRKMGKGYKRYNSQIGESQIDNKYRKRMFKLTKNQRNASLLPSEWHTRKVDNMEI